MFRITTRSHGRVSRWRQSDLCLEERDVHSVNLVKTLLGPLSVPKEVEAREKIER